MYKYTMYYVQINYKLQQCIVVRYIQHSYIRGATVIVVRLSAVENYDESRE
jgi:hypothetical protein